MQRAICLRSEAITKLQIVSTYIYIYTQTYVCMNASICIDINDFLFWPKY